MSVSEFLDVLQAYPTWFKLGVAAALALVVVGLIVLRPAKKTASPTTQNFLGHNIQVNNITVTGGTVNVTQLATGVATPTSPGASLATIIENGGFEQGVEGWGTGFFEGQFVDTGAPVLGFNGAVAQWAVTKGNAHTGEWALRVDHQTPYAPHTFSSFSQRIKVRPGHRYEVRYWVYLETVGKGAFSLRVVPSRRLRTQPDEWDRFKAKADAKLLGQWQEVRREFESGSDWFFDLRFAAEGVLKAWVDDVSVTLLVQSRG